MAEMADKPDKSMLSPGTPPEPIPSMTPVSYANQCGSETAVQTNTYRLFASPPQNVSFQSEMGVGAPRICSATNTTPPWPPRLTAHRERKFCRESTYFCTDSKQDGLPAITPHHPLWATQPQLRLASLRAFSITLTFLPVPPLFPPSPNADQGL
ncbi:hypothetical protein CABS01_00284 [Colletotrichum abscissum]|uniref:uncharacterized protein n=1 Tax=Colletotrichum abscissum TaxID=1671311 RepID=UPI0027D7488B|nr:uncharacterized protein CABS01_00284 [Colletotrichum abscissum]KAK1525195.1 hypothetical protein CABS01_00284 [Colletotrichum abscissum]